jgi:thymidylate kinase
VGGDGLGLTMASENLARSCSWPILIAIEGPSGCGKSTLLRALESQLTDSHRSFRTASNNDTTGWSELIRSLAARPRAAMALALATAGARAELREEADRPVLCDRYVLSTFVYQRFAGLSIDYLYAVNQPLLSRSVTFALTATPAVLAARRSERQSARCDWFKQELDIGREVRLYEEAVDELSGRGHDIRRVNASDEVGALARRLAPEIDELIQADVSG